MVIAVVLFVVVIVGVLVVLYRRKSDAGAVAAVKGDDLRTVAFSNPL